MTFSWIMQSASVPRQNYRKIRESLLPHMHQNTVVWYWIIFGFFRGVLERVRILVKVETVIRIRVTFKVKVRLRVR